MLQTSETGFFKELGDKLREYPKSRCNTSKDCSDLVKKGLHVYFSVRNNSISQENVVYSMI